MGAIALAAEAFTLGFSSGPVCVASCAPVLVPVIAVARPTARGAGATLGRFLAGRLAGYLGFACLAWLLGFSLRLPAPAHAWVYGISDLAIATLLAVYGIEIGRHGRRKECPAGWARRSAFRFQGFAPVLLGFASGLTLCPPFLAAGVRAAESPGLAQALFFFFCFFVGTSLWFAPSISLALLRRFEAVGLVARFVLFLLAGYYTYLAFVVLLRARFHG
ncbi:MAG TPA: sulfite exporter TauE/SafE family protein [Bryobacteraceae bacterium]